MESTHLHHNVPCSETAIEAKITSGGLIVGLTKRAREWKTCIDTCRDRTKLIDAMLDYFAKSIFLGYFFFNLASNPTGPPIAVHAIYGRGWI